MRANRRIIQLSSLVDRRGEEGSSEADYPVVLLCCWDQAINSLIYTDNPVGRCSIMDSLLLIMPVVYCIDSYVSELIICALDDRQQTAGSRQPAAASRNTLYSSC